jgi:glutamine amidotransferase
VTGDVDLAREADGLVVPGVGAFAACMEGLRAARGDEVIRFRRESGRPTLGVCVGMQVLFTTGVEHGVVSPGVGAWPGTVDRLEAQRLPHMGWNTVTVGPGSRLFAGIEDELFYFVHSYAAATWQGNADAVVTYAHHGQSFLAAVEDGPLVATQFHPEKSGDAGAALIAQWVGSL